MTKGTVVMDDDKANGGIEEETAMTQKVRGGRKNVSNERGRSKQGKDDPFNPFAAFSYMKSASITILVLVIIALSLNKRFDTSALLLSALSPSTTERGSVTSTSRFLEFWQCSFLRATSRCKNTVTHASTHRIACCNAALANPKSITQRLFGAVMQVGNGLHILYHYIPYLSNIHLVLMYLTLLSRFSPTCISFAWQEILSMQSVRRSRHRSILRLCQLHQRGARKVKPYYLF